MQLGKYLKALKAKYQAERFARSGSMRVLTDTLSVVIAGALLVGITFVISATLTETGSSGDFNLTGISALLVTLSPLIVGVAYVVIAFSGLGKATGGK